jgi:hypothetical protein
MATLSVCVNLRADIPAPPPPPGSSAPIVVVVDPGIGQARLEIPAKLIQRRAGLDGGTDLGVAERSVNTSMAMVGGALAASLACGGLWLVRRGRSGRTALMLAFVVLLAGAGLAWADLIPPGGKGRARPRAQEKVFEGKVSVQLNAPGDTVRLILPPDVAQAIRGNAPVAPPAQPPSAAKPPE